MPSDAEHEELLTPAECAALWKVDAKTITRWAQAGKLTSIRTLGGHRRYRKSEVMALLNPAPEAPRDPLKAPVSTLWPGAGAVPAAIQGFLKREAITTVGGLTKESAADLSALGLRPPQVDEVRLVLARRGLALAGDVLGEVALARSPAG